MPWAVPLLRSRLLLPGVSIGTRGDKQAIPLAAVPRSPGPRLLPELPHRLDVHGKEARPLC